MIERTHRVLIGLGVLAAVWFATYWLWAPGGERPSEPLVSIDRRTQPSHTTARVPADPDPEDGTSPAPDRASPPRAERPQPEAALIDETVRPPAFREYVVRAGDNFERIAQRELGSGSHWSAIARANPLRDPRRLKPGDVIRIPVDPKNVQGVPSAEPGTPPSPAPENEPDVVRYTVRQNDTLSGIAKTYYGSAGFAEYIFHHNRDVLRNMNSLRVGQVLVLPPAPAGD